MFSLHHGIFDWLGPAKAFLDKGDFLFCSINGPDLLGGIYFLLRVVDLDDI